MGQSQRLYLSAYLSFTGYAKCPRRSNSLVSACLSDYNTIAGGSVNDFDGSVNDFDGSVNGGRLSAVHEYISFLFTDHHGQIHSQIVDFSRETV